MGRETGEVVFETARAVNRKQELFNHIYSLTSVISPSLDLGFSGGKSGSPDRVCFALRRTASARRFRITASPALMP